MNHLFQDTDCLPILKTASHKHGVTIKRDNSSRHRVVTVEEASGCIHMPKTYLTRKGQHHFY